MACLGGPAKEVKHSAEHSTDIQTEQIATSQDVWSCATSDVEHEKTEGHSQAGLQFVVKGRVWKLPIKSQATHIIAVGWACSKLNCDSICRAPYTLAQLSGLCYCYQVFARRLHAQQRPSTPPRAQLS